MWVCVCFFFFSWDCGVISSPQNFTAAWFHSSCSIVGTEWQPFKEAQLGFIIAEQIISPNCWLGTGFFFFFSTRLSRSVLMVWTRTKKATNTHTVLSRSCSNLPGLLIKQIYLAGWLHEKPHWRVQPARFSEFQTLNRKTPQKRQTILLLQTSNTLGSSFICMN